MPALANISALYSAWFNEQEILRFEYSFRAGQHCVPRAMRSKKGPDAALLVKRITMSL